jgi:hypothetical protein
MIKNILFYVIKKNDNRAETITAINKITKKFLHGSVVGSNTIVKIQKDMITQHIKDYDFTKCLNINK